MLVHGVHRKEKNTRMTKKRKERRGEGKEREKSLLFCLYDSAINIHVFMLNNNNNNNNI
jgi:hypothetical protein